MSFAVTSHPRVVLNNPPDYVGNTCRNAVQIVENNPNDELTPALVASETTDVCPTKAKAKARERWKAQTAAGKAHDVKRRVNAVEEHCDDGGEDLSSLIGQDQTLDTLWTDTLNEEVGS